MATKAKKMPREGFRRRVNPYYGNMNRREIAADVAKTAAKWVLFAILAFLYWLVMLLIFSIILLNVWKVSFVQILIYSAVLCGVSALVYAYVLVHRKLFY
jgi:hypothetical protein